MKKFQDYKDYIAPKLYRGIQRKAKKLKGRRIVMVSSTHQAGGVAEILNSIVPLFNDLGLRVGWRIVHGNSDFFIVTKKIHNALQGEGGGLNKAEKKLYEETNRAFSVFTHLDHDLVVIHDPQPLPLRKFYSKKQPWIFRLHVDASEPNRSVYNYICRFINSYDCLVVSHESYIKDHIKTNKSVICPAIDPLTKKNQPLSSKKARAYLKKFGIATKKPIITQISRFDKWKDPLGVLKVFQKVRKKAPCQLVLLGSIADDDPEGQEIYDQVYKEIQQSPYKKDIHQISVSDETLVNALQRSAAAVIQKSTKEGFGLVVAEALYKGTPVVASKVGGIPLQVIDQQNGFLHEPDDIDGFSQSVLKLLKDKKLRGRFGREGKKHIQQNFLIPRLIDDWLNIFLEYLS